MWLLLSIVSSALLGIYDLFKKNSLKGNAFLPVLLGATLTGGMLFFIIMMLSRLGIVEADNIVYVPKVTLKVHLLFMAKSLLVGSSWFFAYYALSNLPITIVVPIRATGPVWTVTGAILIYNERFTGLQWLGIVIAIISSYMFAIAGKKEGISFRKNKWILAIIAGTLLGSCSGLFDKYLLGSYDRMAVQTWFSIYMAIILLPFVYFLWYRKREQKTSFRWKWTIPAIGIVLSLADFAYFYALSEPEALIGVISVIRRGSVLISFTLGAIIFKERNIKAKVLPLAGILAAVILLMLGTK